MKKRLMFVLCLSLTIALMGCTSKGETNKSTETINAQNNVSQTTKDSINESQEIPKVNSKVKLYEGIYFDDKCYGENQLKNYCEVEVSNITNTSFKFTVYEVNLLNGKEDKKVIFAKNTAFFIEDGMKAAFKGKEYSLIFTFPDYHRAFPYVTDMNISGFKQLEGKTYVNNKIPGHEFG